MVTCISDLQCSPQAILENGQFPLRYCKWLLKCDGCYPLVTVDPGSILWRAFFFPSSLFQLDFKSWHGFNPYQIPIFFLSLFSFLPFFFPSFALLVFCPPLISSPHSPCLPSFYSFPIPFLSFLLLVSFFSSPFCCFSFSLSSHYFILLISSSFSLLSLSHCFFLALKFLSCFTSLPRGLL